MKRKVDVDEWLKSGKYLPDVLRDFHDQKDIFKAIHHMIDVQGREYTKQVNWVSGHIYVIDIFLWWMARRGYTLQKTRTRGDFRDLSEDVSEAITNRNRAFTKIIEGSEFPSVG